MLTINPHIYLVSDSTGETVSIVARSVYARFQNIDFTESRWALIRTEKQIDNIIELQKVYENKFETKLKEKDQEIARINSKCSDLERRLIEIENKLNN